MKGDIGLWFYTGKFKHFPRLIYFLFEIDINCNILHIKQYSLYMKLTSGKVSGMDNDRSIFRLCTDRNDWQFYMCQISTYICNNYYGSWRHLKLKTTIIVGGSLRVYTASWHLNIYCRDMTEMLRKWRYNTSNKFTSFI